MGDWVAISVILVVGYVIGRVRPFANWGLHSGQHDINSTVAKAELYRRRSSPRIPRK